MGDSARARLTWPAGAELNWHGTLRAVALTKTTHEQAADERRAYWRSLTPTERVELGVELSRRARTLEQDNGRPLSRVCTLTKRERR